MCLGVSSRSPRVGHGTRWREAARTVTEPGSRHPARVDRGGRRPARPSLGGCRMGRVCPLGSWARWPRAPPSPKAPRGDAASGAWVLLASADTAPTAPPRLRLSLEPRFLFPEKKKKNTRSVSVADIKITHMMAHIYPVQSMHRGRCSLSSKTNQTNGEPCPVVQVQSETGLSSRHGPPPRSPLTPGRPAPRGPALAEPAFYSYSFAFQNHLVFLAPSEGLILQVPGSQLADQQENHRVQ